MRPEDVQEDVELYPDNALAVAVFLEIATQWRHGPGGITGLDYPALFASMDERGLEGEDRRDTYAGVRVMERTVLRMKAEAKDG